MTNDNDPLYLAALKQQLQAAVDSGCDGFIFLESPAPGRSGEERAIPTENVERLHLTTARMIEWGFPRPEIDRACCVNALVEKPPLGRNLSADHVAIAKARFDLAMQFLQPQLLWIAILGSYAEKGSQQVWFERHKVGSDRIIVAGFWHPLAPVYWNPAQRELFEQTARGLFNTVNVRRGSAAKQAS